ncbi:FtsB family cell division protein [Paenibacillus gansuensis]|uniref:Septum formation initiator family protein n=1 Tax=Paenibacillus gansuensis TaxID=306542 RepID=A0ABW5P9F4_9BACL
MAGQTKKTSEQKGLRKRLRLYLFVMICFIAWAGSTLVGQGSKMNDTHSQLKALQKKQKDIELQSEQLKLQLNRLNDPEYIGQIARKDLGMSLPGETSIQVTRPKE